MQKGLRSVSVEGQSSIVPPERSDGDAPHLAVTFCGEAGAVVSLPLPGAGSAMS
jgi:hypothetical protein